MFSKKNSSHKIDPEQRELIERAQERARQKRRLYQHVIFFLIGAIVFIVLNVAFEYGQDIRPFGIDWFVWAILVWAVILLLHVYNVFVTNRFLGKDWENRQIEKLVAKQHRRIDELQKKVERENSLPAPENGSKDTEIKSSASSRPKTDPDKPIDPDSPINS